MKKPTITRLDRPYKLTQNGPVVYWRWTCPNHNVGRKGYSAYDYATRPEALAGLFDHLSRYHEEYHRCVHCNAPRDKLLKVREQTYPHPRVSYKCESCGYNFQVRMGPTNITPKTCWPPGSGNYPFMKHS